MGAVLDTHAVLWYLLDEQRLSDAASSVIDNAAATATPVHISSISLVEVTYLVERRRVPSQAFDILIKELESDRPTFRIAALDAGVAKALRNIPRDLVPDMPDRIIAATALYLKLPLVTCDRQIRAAGIPTIW